MPDGKMDWSARQYLLFEAERSRPVRDLLLAAAAAAGPVRRAIDLGCGPGNSTELLAGRFAGAAVRGLDSAPDMIAEARRRLPHCRLDLGSILDWADPDRAGEEAGERYDMILANAVLQWLPDHASLVPRLIDRLAPGGTLAVQLPDNLDEPSHTLMRDIAADGPWKAELAPAMLRYTNRHAPEWYYTLLRRQCAYVDLWRTVYYHPLSGGADAVVDWFQGTGLRPYLAPLDETQRKAFLTRYRTGIAASYPRLDDGTVLMPYPRLFFVARR